MDLNRAVILGTGPVGIWSARSLAAKGYSVHFLSRSGRNPLAAETNIQSSAAAVDALDLAALTKAIGQATVVIHAMNVPYQEWYTTLRVLQNNIIAATEPSGAVLVASENLYTYDPESQPFTEHSRVNPPTKKGRVREELFQELMTAHSQGKIRAASVRASDYYGPEALASAYFGERFIKPLLAGKNPSLVGNPDKLHSYTYLPDYGKAIATIADTSSAWGRTWHAPTAPAISARALAQIFFRKATKPNARLGTMGRGMLSFAGVFVPFIREVKEMLYQFENDFVIDSSEFEKTFAAKPTSFEDGVRETLAWWQNR